MSPNNDRDPTNPEALAAYLRSLRSLIVAADLLPGHADTAFRAVAAAHEQIAQALLDELLAQGVLTPSERDGAYLADDQLEDADDLTVTVRAEGLGWLNVYEDGSVEVFVD